MKKLLCLLLAALMLFSLAACGDSADKENSKDNGTVEGSKDEAASKDEAPSDVAALPDVKGKAEADAIAALKAAGYTNVKTVKGYKAGSTAGNVFAQSKTPGAVYGGDDLIILQVSNGLSAADSAKSEIVDPILAAREELAVGANSDYKPTNYANMKAMWLSQLDLIPVYYDYDKKAQRTEDDFAAKIDVIMKNIKDSGFNTVVVQVHPDADSMYASKLYPWSDYLNGNTNRDENQTPMKNDNDPATMSYGNTSLYDLMPIMIDAAHKYELSYQAWINPMRACTVDEMQYVNNAYPIKQWVNDKEKAATYLFQYNNRYYLNPAYEEVRNYIVDVAKEICRYYDVDGVHLDDYFYPAAMISFDKTAYDAQTQFTNLNEFRKNNINVLVKALYDAVKAENKDMLFGISPAGNIENNMNSLSADVKTWCQVDGYIDYICPQIYFGMEHTNFSFPSLSQRWIDMTTAESVDVVLGLTMHKVGKQDPYAGAGIKEWIDKNDVLKRSFEWVQENIANVDGICMFSYHFLFDPLTGERAEATKAEGDNYLPVMQGLKW